MLQQLTHAESGRQTYITGGCGAWLLRLGIAHLVSGQERPPSMEVRYLGLQVMYSDLMGRPLVVIRPAVAGRRNSHCPTSNPYV